MLCRNFKRKSKKYQQRNCLCKIKYFKKIKVIKVEKNKFMKLFSFEEMKVWMAQFTLAIKNEDREKITDLLSDNADYFMNRLLFLVTNDLVNLQTNQSTEEILENFFEKVNKNIFEVLDFIWNGNYHKNNIEKIYLEEEILKILKKPIIISRISPFALSGEYLFHLSGVEYTKYKRSTYEYCEDYAIKYKRYYNKNYGRNGEALNVKAYLERALNIDLKEKPQGKESDLWHLCELADILERELFESKSESSSREGTRPLWHLLADFEDYYCYTDEILKNCDMNTSKIMMFRTLLFQHLDYKDMYRFIEMQKFALEFEMNFMLKLCYLGIGEAKYLLTLGDIKKILQSEYLKNILNKDTIKIEKLNDIPVECFIDYEDICNQLENRYREENKKLENDSKPNEKFNVFFECLWKIFLTDLFADIKQMRNLYYLMNYKGRKNLDKNYINAIRRIEKIREQGKPVRQEDKDYFFEKYNEKIWGIIFPKITRKDFCRLWDISCRIYVLLNAGILNVEFEKIRLLNKTEKKPSKKFSIPSEIKFDIVQLSTIIEVVDFSKNIDGDGIAGIKKFGYKILKKDFFHILENISKYSSDTVITAVQRMILYQTSYRQSIMAGMPFQLNAPIQILLKTIDLLEQSVKSLKPSQITFEVLYNTTQDLLQTLENELEKLNQAPLVLLHDKMNMEIKKKQSCQS